jgi:hypothetical protein
MAAVLQEPMSAQQFLQSTDARATFTHTVKVPRELKEYRHGIGIALFNLTLGRAQPVYTSSVDLISVDFVLSARAQAYLLELLASPAYNGNKRKAFCSALTWLREQPTHVHQTKI